MFENGNQNNMPVHNYPYDLFTGVVNISVVIF